MKKILLGFFVITFIGCLSIKGHSQKLSILFAGTANQSLARDVGRLLALPLAPVAIKRFGDKEIFIDLLTSVRGKTVCVVQPMAPPVNDALMETLLFIDALKRASAEKIILCCPYLGYARQDRRTTKRSPISAKLVASLLEKAGVHQVVTVDMHADQIQGFFSVPCDGLLTTELYARDMQERFQNQSFVIVAPDVGALRRNRFLAKKLGCDLVVIDKRRDAEGVTEVMNVIGRVKGKMCILVDDLVDSGGTLCKAAAALMEKGASSVHVYCTHAVLSGCAKERLAQAPIQSLTISDSIMQKKLPQKFRVISLASLLADALRCAL